MTIILGNTKASIPSSAATAPSDVLQIIYCYLSPVPHSRCSPNDLQAHLHSIQRVAAVNQQWRSTALPMFYRTVHVVIGDIDAKIVKKDAFAHINRPSCIRDDEDEAKKKEVEPPVTGVDIKLRTNIDLLRAAGQADSAREVQIVVQGLGQTAVQLLHQLQLAGLVGGKTVWPGAERLRIDMRYSHYSTQTKERQDFRFGLHDCIESGTGHLYHQALNEFLSQALPSLREIEYYGHSTQEIYRVVPINGLIYERLHGPTPLRALRIVGDCGPDVTNVNNNKAAPDAPVRIERLEIDTDDNMFSISMPLVIASSLVELKLDPVIVDEVWRLFVSEVAPTSARSRLLFSSLQTLKLGFSSRHEYFLNKPVESRTFDVSSNDGDTLFSKIKPRFMRSAQYGRPKFPVLTTLEIHHFPRSVQKFLTLFTASPITSLVICDTPFSVRAALDMTKFRALRSLSFRITDVMDLRQTTNINEALSDVFSTVAPSLQRLTLAMEIDKSLGLQFATPPFADNLRSLTLEGEYGQRDVVHLLQLFPNLYRLDVCITVGEPITTMANLVDEYRRANTAQSLAPLNSSLRIMSAYVQRYFTEPGGSYTRHALAPGLYNYRGILVGIVCRLPALVTLRVDAKSFDGVNESIHALVDSSVGPEHIDCLRRLRVQPLGK